MTARTTLLLALAIGSLAFLLGNRLPESEPNSKSIAEHRRLARTRPESPARVDGPRDRGKSSFASVTRDQAEQLSPDQRLALLGKAVKLADINQQGAILCGLIAAMSRDELPAATRELLNARTHGADISHAVWSSLWQRVGQLAPEIVLNSDPSASSVVGKDNWPNFMNGWLETDPEAAMKWAREGGHAEHLAPAVALAIIHSAGGNLKQMESVILTQSPDVATTRECLQNFYDLAIFSGSRNDAAEVYENLAPPLREAAWPVTLGRLRYTAPRDAAAWVEAHANEPGVDYHQTQRLVSVLGNEDPAWTMEWLGRVEVDNEKDGVLQGPPLSWILERIWENKDQEAAKAWEETKRAKFESADPLNPIHE